MYCTSHSSITDILTMSYVTYRINDALTRTPLISTPSYLHPRYHVHYNFFAITYTIGLQLNPVPSHLPFRIVLPVKVLKAIVLSGFSILFPTNLKLIELIILCISGELYKLLSRELRIFCLFYFPSTLI